MHKDTIASHRHIASIIILLLITGIASPLITAHPGEETELPRGSPPTIDGIVEIEEWNGSEVITLSVGGNQADIYFKHNGEYIYFGFDIQEGHNSALPDTRIFFDTLHDAADSPQEDDYQLYINPDNGGLVERQGDGQSWQDVDIEHWTGDWDEDGTDHWTTEYSVSSEKFGNFTGNETFGFALYVYGNSPGAVDVWPDNAEENDPSTWGHISFLNWTEEEEEDPTSPPHEQPGNNETDPNSTTNETDDDDNENLISISIMSTLGGMSGAVLAVFLRREKVR